MATDQRGNPLQSYGDARPHLELRVALGRIREATSEPATTAPRARASGPAISSPVPRRGPKMGDLSQADNDSYAQTKPPAITRPGQAPREPRVSTGGAPPPMAFPTRNVPAAYDVMEQSRQQRNEAAEKLGKRQVGPAIAVRNRGGAESPILRELVPLIRNKPGSEETKKVARRFGAPLYIETRRKVTEHLMAQPNKGTGARVLSEPTDRSQWSEDTIRSYNEENVRLRQQSALAERINETNPITYGTVKGPLTKSRKGKALESKVTKALGIGTGKETPRTTQRLQPFPTKTRPDIPEGTLLQGPLLSEATVTPTSYQRITVPIVTKDKFGNTTPVVSARRVTTRDAVETLSPKESEPVYNRETGEKEQVGATDFQRQYGYLQVPRPRNLPGPNVDVGRETNVSGRPTIVTKGSTDVRGTYRPGDPSAIRAGMTKAGGMASEVRRSHLAIEDIPGIDILGKKGIYRSPQLAEIAKQALLNMTPAQRTLRGAALEQRVMQRRGSATTPELRESVERGQQASAKILSRPDLWLQRGGGREQILRKPFGSRKEIETGAGAAAGEGLRRTGSAGRRQFVNPEASKAMTERLTKAQEMEEYRTLRARGRELDRKQAIEGEDPEEVVSVRKSLGLLPQLPKQVSIIEPSEEVVPEESKDTGKKTKIAQTMADLADPSYIVKSRQKRGTLRRIARGESPEKLQGEYEAERLAGAQVPVQPERVPVSKTETTKTPAKTPVRGKQKEAAKRAAPKAMSALERRAYLAQKKEGKKK